MNTLKRLFALVGGITVVAIAGAIVAPKAAKAVTALLVQVTNTAANPVPTADVGKSPAQIVELVCSSFLNAGVSGEACGQIDPNVGFDGEFPNGVFTVPAGQHLVITTVDALAFGSGGTFELDQITGQFVDAQREIFTVPTNVMVQFQYPASGIVIGPGSQLVFNGPGSVIVTLRGYLTAN